MISDSELYQLAIFLGSTAMALIVVYHYLEVNADDSGKASEKSQLKSAEATASG
ncbi:hypothetical protein ACRALDRAFT_1060342 [Sodiomyces alcalophilus JCM 7366]|uniref:uncharacterized protein n=1 Tax=Sodiomyces alcalophilus JCM 7366 TaxID=591952 RepID=UPI0039B3E632